MTIRELEIALANAKAEERKKLASTAFEFWKTTFVGQCRAFTHWSRDRNGANEGEPICVGFLRIMNDTKIDHFDSTKIEFTVRKVFVERVKYGDAVTVIRRAGKEKAYLHDAQSSNFNPFADYSNTRIITKAQFDEQWDAAGAYLTRLLNDWQHFPRADAPSTNRKLILDALPEIQSLPTRRLQPRRNA